jgi:hypothetical protein
LSNHPDNFDRMYLEDRSPLLDPASTALWEQYTDEFTAFPAAATQFSSKWDTEADARRHHRLQAFEICWAATARKDAVEAQLGLGRPDMETSTILPEIAALQEAIARISEEVVAEIRALPAPDTARGMFDEFYRLAEQTIDIHRQIAAAASAGDTALVETLSWERVDLSHKTQLAGCPVELPA